MVKILNSPASKELLDEINAIEGSRCLLFENLNNATTLEQYCQSFVTSAGGLEFLERMKFTLPMKILDIGFGRGETSLLLASKGHIVHAIEPSPLNCEILQEGARKYRLEKEIKIYQSPAEHIDQIKEEDFDLCLFNSSLHHCDDPLRALKICKYKLKINGRVIAINEPILKFYRTKKWFFKTLKENPVALGHYGGNEHMYHFHEYVKMLKEAGFLVKTYFHVRHQVPRQVIKENIVRKEKGQFVYSDLKLAIKFNILLIIKVLISKRIIKRFIVVLAKKLSLFAFSFEGKS